MKRTRITLAIALLVAGLIVLEDRLISKNYGISIFPHETLFREKVSSLRISSTSRPARRVIKVLFIGNSFTSINDFPGKLVDIASSDPSNEVEFQIQSVTKNAASLGDMLRDTGAPEILRSEHWDYVVLQEKSAWINSQQDIDDAFISVRQWLDAIKKIHATALFLENWSDNNGSIQFKSWRYAQFGNTADSAQALITAHSQSLGRSLNLEIVPVGSSWARLRKDAHGPDLYLSDYHHPSAAGAYLTALVFYYYFTHGPLDHITFKPDDITPDQVDEIISAVSR